MYGLMHVKLPFSKQKSEYDLKHAYFLLFIAFYKTDVRVVQYFSDVYAILRVKWAVRKRRPKPVEHDMLQNIPVEPLRYNLGIFFLTRCSIYKILNFLTYIFLFVPKDICWVSEIWLLCWSISMVALLPAKMYEVDETIL